MCQSVLPGGTRMRGAVVFSQKAMSRGGVLASPRVRFWTGGKVLRKNQNKTYLGGARRLLLLPGDTGISRVKKKMVVPKKGHVRLSLG